MSGPADGKEFEEVLKSEEKINDIAEGEVRPAPLAARSPFETGPWGSGPLWIYTSIVGAMLGAAFLFYIKDTRIGLWAYGRFDAVIDYFRDKYGWTWLNQDEDAWKKVNPKIAAKISELEARLENLEGKV